MFSAFIGLANRYNSHGRTCGDRGPCIQFTSDLPKTEKPYTFLDHLWDMSYEGQRWEDDRRREREEAAHKAYRESDGSMNALILSLVTSDAFLYRTQEK